MSSYEGLKAKVDRMKEAVHDGDRQKYREICGEILIDANVPKFLRENPDWQDPDDSLKVHPDKVIMTFNLVLGGNYSSPKGETRIESEFWIKPKFRTRLLVGSDWCGGWHSRTV